MPYHLLTGATGLLGTYLLRDLPSRGISLAVVVRGATAESSRQRIENIMARWERVAGHTLPRPVVLEGDITQDDLGLDRSDLRWIADHCDTVIHNAASLTFANDEKTGEPWRSNVTGTRNVLDVCRAAGIRRFHHVSTAYVCGTRRGKVFEREVDVGQEPSNDYEASKLEAEKMVRDVGFLERLTVFRPAIIVGDSQTAYTSTYHGFYAPLRVFYGFAKATLPGELTVAAILGFLGLSGEEQKNFVPVDWVSAVMSEVISTTRLHGATYHLTPRQRVSQAEMGEVMAHCLMEYRERIPGGQTSTAGLAQLSKTFQDQMDVYKSYWRDDPEFDATNTNRALPQRPCPTVDSALMTRLCSYAIQQNFGWPRPKPSVPEIDWVDRLGTVASTDVNRGSSYNLQVNGPGGGQWQILVQEDRELTFRLGHADQAGALFYLNSHTLKRMLAGEWTFVESVRSGRLHLEGKVLRLGELEQVFEALLARLREGHASRSTGIREFQTS